MIVGLKEVALPYGWLRQEASSFSIIREDGKISAQEVVEANLAWKN